MVYGREASGGASRRIHSRDDDIDIGMLRQDYDCFVNLAQHGLPDGYELQTFENNEAFVGIAKVCKTGTEFRTKETAEA
ncbi:MAG: LicD family protein [Eggerthellaceae bacterium]